MKTFEQVVGYFEIEASARMAIDTETNEGAPAYARVVLNKVTRSKIARSGLRSIVNEMIEQLIAGTSIRADQVKSISREEYESKSGID